MEVADFQNFDGSEDEAEDAAELEAHLYSKIYYETEETTTAEASGPPTNQTSVSLYTETKDLPATDSGIGSSPDLTNTPNDITQIDDDVILIDSDVEQEQNTDNQPRPDRSSGKCKSYLGQMSNNRKRETNSEDDVIIIESDDDTTPVTMLLSTSSFKKVDLTDENDTSEASDAELNEPTPSTSQFNVDEFISNVFDKNKFKSKNPFYVESDTDNEESDTTETTSEEIVVSSANLSANEEMTNKYAVAGKKTVPSKKTLEKKSPDQEKPDSSNSDSSSSDEDEGIQIIKEVDVALERSLRAEVVDLIESDESELELDDKNKFKAKAAVSASVTKIKKTNPLTSTSKSNPPTSTSKAKIKIVQPSPSMSQKNSSNAVMSREEARSGKVVVEREREKGKNTSTVKRAPFFVAQKDFSSSDDSTTSSDEETDFANSSRLSLNLSGASFGGRGGHRSVFQTFRQITGMSPTAHRATKNIIKSWTPDMSRYYNELDPDLVDITLDDLLDQLPDNANWSVGAKDRYTSPGGRGGASGRRNNRYFNSPAFLACSICGLKGHRPNTCTRRGQDQRKCYMCGGDDHSKFSCPNAMCLRCGQPGMPYTSTCNRCRHILDMDCHHCGGRGHMARACPDHWRRYHLTISPGDIVVPENGTPGYSNIWCPNCARNGHYVHQCRALSVSQTPKSVLSVVSYEQRRKRKHVTQPELRVPPLEVSYQPEIEYEERYPLRESDSARKKRLKAELKEKKRAYRSFPNTPMAQASTNELGPYRGRRNASEPTSPIEINPNLNLSVFSVTRNLNEAKEKLIQMTKQKFAEKKRKNKNKKQKNLAAKNPRGELPVVTQKKFSPQFHQPQPFPRGSGEFGSGSKKKPRHTSAFSPHFDPTKSTNRGRRTTERMIEWKQKHKNLRLKKKKSGRALENEDFISK